MKDPIKIIHKFKNINRRYQYVVYIFIGPLVPNNINKILNSIEKKNFYNSLLSLSKKHYRELVDYYGKKWYTLFFTSYHINDQLKIIFKNKEKKNNINKKFGSTWLQDNFNDISKKIEFSFSTNYYNILLEKNKIKTKTRKREMDFRTYSNDMVGGDDTSIEGNSDIDDIINEEEKDDDDEITEEELDDEVSEDFDLDELTKLYSLEQVESDKTIKETSKLISDAVKDKKWEKNISESEMSYDNSYDSIQYDQKISDIFIKKYIRNQYIFKDDTIKIMRNKIAISIPMNPVFGKENNHLPEYLYFWSEYKLQKKKAKDQVMIGQKWIRRNELLSIDVEPNDNFKVYENLRNNLAYLKESFGYKIKREDDETNIIRFYDEYMTNNEIFMIDIFNEIGLNYNSEKDKIRNVYDVYINIYFPLITFERFENIISLLNSKEDKENIFNKSHFVNIQNDMKLENEIYTTVEQAKISSSKYDKYFFPNHIIQSIIHVNLTNDKNITGTISDEKYNLYRIFDNFKVTPEYPFIQYQTPDSQINYKLLTKTKKIDNNEILAKWFENEPYGISFKHKVSDEKYISINFKENGRMDYKITWKEINKATVNDIKKSYKYIKNLLDKINSENKKIKIMPPNESRFKYAFINTILKFTLPEKFKINHNDLSEFCRFFFPYIALVIEPKKRESKKTNKTSKSSKYGTYLRYKRINKYENRTRMHLRMLYFLRNFDLNDKELIEEVSKQFNITKEDASKELDYVKDKYSKAIKKSSKILKKLKSLPGSKPPGIDISIQGRDRDRYKIRIAGARSKNQLIEIVGFMKVLIYLYSETYLYKKPKFQKLKKILEGLTKIAKRRNKVTEYVNYHSSIKNVKDITSLDKQRLGFKPEKGQSQWTRSCQNSGNDKKRRPIIVPGNDISKLIKMGYKYNKETDFYEKQVDIKIRGKTSKVKLKAIKLYVPGDISKFNFYTCDPSNNNEHTFIGFLSRGNNPDDLCMPCCFRKDQLTSGNNKKELYFRKCIGQKIKDENIEKQTTDNIGDKIYILQETNKIQEGRFIFLTKTLNIFFNVAWGNTNKIKNHYLLESNTGYYFKFTVKDKNYNYLAAISNIYNISIDEIKIKLIKTLNNDKKNSIYTYLNNGDIKETFGDKINYINYIKNSNYLEYDIIGELLSIKNVISKKQIYHFILEKKSKIIRKAFDKDHKKLRYYLLSNNIENSYQIDDNNDYIIILKEGKYYFPIYRVKKDNKVDKKILLDKKFDNSDKFKNIIDNLIKYYSQSCLNTLISKITSPISLKNKILIKILTNNNIKIKKQILDTRNKVRYIILEKLIIPVVPSGSIHTIPYIYLQDYKKKFPDIKTSLKEINKINLKIDLDYVPTTIFYNKKNNNNLTAVSILFKNGLLLPIKEEVISISKIKNLGLNYKFKSLEELIDKNIIENKNINDNRLLRVKTHLHTSEGYNLYRLELSLFLSKNTNIKNEIITITRNDSFKNKKSELLKILFSIIKTKLNKKYKNKQNNKTMANTVPKIDNIEKYNINNTRNYCSANKNKNKCNNDLHCIWTQNKCKFKLIENIAIEYINKVVEEIIDNGIKFKELIQENNYYVSDIVNYSEFTNREHQKIIKTTNFNIKKIMTELFGQEQIPTIGKKKINILNNENNENNENEYDLIEIGNKLIQPIISNSDSILRAYSNSYYWINNNLYDNESRNLGNMSQLQTQITYILKANIIDFIQKNKNNKKFTKINKKFKNKDNFFISEINKYRKTNYNTDGITELTILSYIFPYPIIVYDNYSNVKYIFNKGQIKIDKNKIKNFTDKNKNVIFLKFDYETNKNIPSKIYSIYYI